ncbi:MAG: hypothetical protein V5A52_07315 [Halovenus sp.]
MSPVHRQNDAETKLQTGIQQIDRELDGGIEQGSLLSVIAGPATQSEALFQQLIGERPTLYLTTLREPESVEQRLGCESDEVFVKDVRGSQTMDREFTKQITGARSY